MRQYTLFCAVMLLFFASHARHSYQTTCVYQGEPTVEKIIKGVPADLNKHVLLVPRYDLIEPDDAMPPAKRKNMLAANQLVKEGNTTIDKMLKKSYDYEYKMISLSEVGYYKEEGYKYFLDLVTMPKQMTQPKKEAMVASFRGFRSANRMFRNFNTQFHYYFYIRDLTTENAYITTKFRGDSQAYKGMGKFLKQAVSDTNN